MGVVSRLELNHPALGTPGGSALYSSIEAIYTKIGDNMADRYFAIQNLNAAASVDCDHNFNTDIGNLHFDVYSWNEGTGELTYLTESTTPKLSEISIIAKVGDTKKQVTVTNNSSSQVDLGLVINQQVIKLTEGDVKDVDVTGVEDGQSVVWNASLQKFISGASGDSSFKLQSINSSGTQLVIKAGFWKLSDGRVMYRATDLTIDVSSIITSNGYWYAYIDVNTLSASSIVSGRKLVAITSANFIYSETAPEDIDGTRYISVGQITRSGGSFTLVTTEAYRAHQFPLGADKSLEYTLPLQSIGSVGSAGQIAAGHVLAQNSFPSAAYAATSFYNLTNVTTVNDGNTSLNHILTNNGSTPFTGTGILGLPNSCVDLNGSSHYLSSSDAHFDPGPTDFTFGCWVKPTHANGWINPGCIAAQYGTSGNISYALRITYGSGTYAALQFLLSSNSTSLTDYAEMLIVAASPPTGWHHVAARYTNSTKKAEIFFDGRKVAEKTMSASLANAGSDSFALGAFSGGSGFFQGLIDEFFFCNGTAYTDNDIAKIYASKLTHSRTLAPVSQSWMFTGISAGGQARELTDVIVDMDIDDLYFDLSDELSTTQAELKLYNRSSIGLSKAAKPRTLMMTVDTLDGLLPISHGLGVVPEISFKVKNGNGDYEPTDCSAFVVNTTQIKIADGSLVSLYGTLTDCILTYSTAPLAHFVPNRFWNTYKASASQAVLANDKILANTASVPITLTLPGSPGIGDTIQFLDFARTWGTNNLTIGRNTKSIAGSATDLVCNVSGARVELTYDGEGNWILN